MVGSVWFILFSLIWTGLLAGGASLITAAPTPARFAHTVWRFAAALSVLPWLILAGAAVWPDALPTTIPDLPYINGAADAIAATPGLQIAADPARLPWLGWLSLGVLVSGWAARLCLNLFAQLRLQMIKREAMPDNTFDAAIWAQKLGLKTAPRIARIAHGSPFLAGIYTRTVYLPQGLDDPADIAVIVAHECTHIARGDLVTRPIERSVADLFWFSPFAWMMRGQLDYWREAACDEATAALTGDSVAYARTLAQTARVAQSARPAALPVAAFILPRHRTLKKRLTQLLDKPERHPRRRLALVVLGISLALAPLSLAQSGSLIGSQSIFSHPIIPEGAVKVSAPFGKVYDARKAKHWTHNGVDIAAPMFTPVYAPADAKVLLAEKKLSHGYTVDLMFKDGRKMRLSQLAKFTVAAGDEIPAGTLIGKVGASGSTATGPHLHLELWDSGELVDPMEADGLVLFEDCCPDAEPKPLAKT